jgi:elongation factor P
VLGLTDLKAGVTIELEGQPYQIISNEHSKMGRGGAVMRTKLKNLVTGAALERTFKASDKVEAARLEKKGVQYLYRDGDALTFMDSATFEQSVLGVGELGGVVQFLKEGESYELLLFRGRAISVDLPAKVVLGVTHTEPGEKGNTANAATKPATLETGLTLQVPLFVKMGDQVRVDTRTGQYVERV